MAAAGGRPDSQPSRIVAVARRSSKDARGKGVRGALTAIGAGVLAGLAGVEAASTRLLSSADADVLNDWSLQAFLTCGVEAVIGIALDAAGLPMVFTLLASAFGRVCIGVIAIVHLFIVTPEAIAALGDGDTRDVNVKRTINAICAACVGAASWPAMLYVTPAMVAAGRNSQTGLQQALCNEVLVSYFAALGLELFVLTVAPIILAIAHRSQHPESSGGTACWTAVEVVSSCAFARGPVIFVSLLWTILWQALRAPHMTMLVNVLQGLLLLPGGAACVAAVAFTLATLAAALRAHSIQRRMTDLHGIYAAMSSGSNAYALTMDVHTGRLGVARKQRDLSALLAACTGSLGAIFVAIGMHLSSTISAALTGGRLEIRDAYGSLSGRLAGALASSSSQWAPVVGLWVAVKLLGLMALVCLSRALQNLWDAEDDFTAAFPLQPLEDADEGASSRQMLAACQAHVLKHEAVPSTLEKVADGRYARTADDAEARSEGIQLSTNPLHELRAVQGALQRRARRSFRQQHGHKPLASVCTDCHRAVSAVSSDSSAAATAMATLPTLHALPVKDATAAATGSSTSLQPASPLPAYMRSRCTACRTNLEAVRRSVLVARSLQHSLQHGLHVVASVTSVAHHSGNGTPKAAGGCGGRDAGVCAGPPNSVCLTSVTPSVISSPTGGEPSHTSITNPMYQASSAVAAVQQKPPAALVPGLRLPLPAMPVAPLASPLVQSARGGRALALGSPRAFVAAASEVVAAGLVLTSPRGGSGPAHDRAHDRAQRPQAPAPLAAAASNGPAPSCVITDDCHRSDVAIHAAGAGASVQSPTAASMAALVRFAVSPSGCMPASLSDVTPRMADAREPCFICFECEGDAVFMECGHGGVCARCARTILCGVTGIDGVEEGHKEPRCPMCRATVAQVLRVGPDVHTLDGRVVAQVLPQIYWSDGKPLPSLRSDAELSTVRSMGDVEAAGVAVDDV